MGTTHASSQSAVFASNLATAPCPEGTVAGCGVFGETTVPNASGVFGANNNGGTGVTAVSSSPSGIGLFATGGQNAGVFDGNVQVNGNHSVTGTVNADTLNANTLNAGPINATSVWATEESPQGQGQAALAGVSGWNPGIYAAGRPAGKFEGDVGVTGNHSVTGDVSVGGNHSVTGNVSVGGQVIASGSVSGSDVILQGQDCAEEFDLGDSSGEIALGSVVVFDDAGAPTVSDKEYNKQVAGVVSRAGSYRPGVILGRGASPRNTLPVALVGRVFCKVDAGCGRVEVGDLLTTAATPGHAMKAQDPSRAFGAVIGKALAGLERGRGLIPVLVTVQ